jgi:tetratricopeptide (TPR) repeat protein
MSKKSRNKSKLLADPNKSVMQAKAIFHQAVLLHQQGQLTQAQTLYENVLKSLPRDFNSLHLLGVISYQTNKHERAVELIAKAIGINPNMAEPYSNIGLALRALERLDEALASYDKALAIKPDYTEAYNNRGNVLKDLNRQDDALASYDKALALKPNYADAHFNRGNALLDLKRLDEALTSYDKALALKPDYADVYTNRATVLKDLKRLDAAIADYDRAIAIKPDFAGAYWNKSLALLLVGDFANGWELYEWRWLKGKKPPKQRYVAQPRWLGSESLKDKTILLHSEQGFGDTIQFCRYATLVEQLGATVLLEVQPPLLKLLSGLEGVCQVVAEGETLPPFDYHCPLMSLPFAFKTTLGTIPADIPYIKADPSKATYWHNKLGVHDKPRVGLVWSGGFRPYQPEIWAVNERRNIPLELISRINSPEIDFYSLQKGEPAESELLRRKQEVWPEANLFSFTQELNDFSDTAALIENLDLVLCVDTSTAHLAAAMGKPTWILNRFDSCWRWLLDRDDSPWYPTAKLYRQQQMGDWESVLEQVKTDLSKVALSRPPAVEATE